MAERALLISWTRVAAKWRFFDNALHYSKFVNRDCYGSMFFTSRSLYFILVSRYRYLPHVTFHTFTFEKTFVSSKNQPEFKLPLKSHIYAKILFITFYYYKTVKYGEVVT